MKKYLDNEKLLKHFAQNQLGCNCPEEVFDSIQTGHKFITVLPDILIQQFVIGSRLLIYIVPAQEKESNLEQLLESIVTEGKRERDLHRYNRFRLVLQSSQKNRVVDQAFLYFNRMTSIDDRIHLHIFDESEIPGPLYNLPSKDTKKS